MSEHLRAGVGRADITPPIGTLLMGYPDPYGERRAEAASSTHCMRLPSCSPGVATRGPW